MLYGGLLGSQLGIKERTLGATLTGFQRRTRLDWRLSLLAEASGGGPALLGLQVLVLAI